MVLYFFYPGELDFNPKVMLPERLGDYKIRITVWWGLTRFLSYT